jgi:uncharacterized protein
LKFENQYIIAFRGLKEGSHDFIFKVGKSFIEDHEFLEASDGNFEVKVNMVKKTTHLSFTIDIHGFIEVQCDRCLDCFPLEINFNGDLHVKFSGTPQESDSEIIILHPGDDEIDMSKYIFEGIGLSIPYRKVHPQGNLNESGCNKEMLVRLGEYMIPGVNKNNPMQDKLKNLL